MTGRGSQVQTRPHVAGVEAVGRERSALRAPLPVERAEERLLFGGTAPQIYPARRGRGLAVAFLLHAVVLAPVVVSVVSYRERPTQVMEAVGVTFVLAPERGAGSPAPSQTPEPERTAPSPSPPKPAIAGVQAEVPLLAAELPYPLMTTLALNVPPGPISPDVSGEAGAAEAAIVAEPAESSGSGPGGHSDSALPPAIGTPTGQSNWAGLVLGRLEQFRRYPPPARRDRQEGVCYVRFTIDREGHVLDSSLDRTSGHALLDREAVSLVRRADPLPAPPPELEGDTITLTVPVEFFLTR